MIHLFILNNILLLFKILLIINLKFKWLHEPPLIRYENLHHPISLRVGKQRIVVFVTLFSVFPLRC